MKILKIWQKITGKATRINLEPINKISLFMLILIDIFVLWNVFTGLNSVQNTILSPSSSHSCFSPWQNYRDSKSTTKKYDFINLQIDKSRANIPNFGSNYDSNYNTNYSVSSSSLVGTKNSICQEYESLSNDARQSKELVQIEIQITSLESQINNLERQNSDLERQYNSTLLEKIAGQNQSQSINASTSDKTKSSIDENTSQISKLQTQKEKAQNDVISNSTAQKLLTLVDDSAKFVNLKSSFDSENFRYPILLFVFQILFLTPLILTSLAIHLLATKKNWGLLAVVSWNLFLVFCVPAVLKVFEFLQFGVLANFILEFLGILVGSLAFLGSYLLILIIPLFGYLVILFFQKIVFNKTGQFKKRLTAKECFHCGFKLNNGELFCPNCGTNQSKTCANCGKLKYKNMPFCQHCGAPEIVEKTAKNSENKKPTNQKIN